MIRFEKFTLSNGLKVLVHEDKNTPLVAVNVLYNVGSKDENPSRTGFAHLFEHLMFGGSLNVPDFDGPIQNAGGENNAFTNCDITNFYNLVPANNIEVALWLESDRMMQLAFSEKSLEVQKKVVIEEFKETTLNKPYGDFWHKMSSLVYKDHPYKWPTIGLIPDHIADANLDDVKAFFYKFYRPNNAILSISGNVDFNEIKSLVEKWFEPIPSGEDYYRSLPQEKAQNEKRSLNVEADVPSNAIYIAFPMPGRASKEFPIYDLLSDVLSGGPSSRFEKDLVKPATHFMQLYAYVTGTIDQGLFLVEGKLLPGVDMEESIALIWKSLEEMKEELVATREMEKIKNKYLSSMIFSDVSILNKAINLAFYELIGNADLINQQEEMYNAVSAEDIQRVAKDLFVDSKSNEIQYLIKENV